ncbi:hypothetical protein Vadar_014856 [Vaccinium darrowii]|uniref:Uncharacterized protein n=1 Tax=Vaccinium darrowii TaxID=229202 RepID=A0ACB7X0T4_9ERIC|nr:hypothetical protein Vadar_014856 [Vaccinium darrowii]
MLFNNVPASSITFQIEKSPRAYLSLFYSFCSGRRIKAIFGYLSPAKANLATEQDLAFDLSLAALLGENIYNFGELLAHPIPVQQCLPNPHIKEAQRS